VKDLFPIDIAHFQAAHSRIHYVDTSGAPPVDLWLDNLEINATGLQNRPGGDAGAMPANLTLSADTIGGGRLTLFVSAEPLAARPHFEFRGSLRSVSLPALNDFLMAYGGVDVGRGTFHGYVKPFLKDVHFATPSDKSKPVLLRLWKDIVAGVEKLLRDKPQGELATIIPFNGRFEGSTVVATLPTIGNLLHNSFVEALRHNFEGTPGARAPQPATEPGGGGPDSVGSGSRSH
jgi:hypothetical protein